VQNQQFTRPVALSSLCDDLLRTGHRPRTDMLAHETVAADDRVAAALQVPTGTDIVRLRRLRGAREVPMAIMCNWLPTHLATFSAEDLVTQGLYELLRRTGVQMRIARQRIGARAATPEENRVLHEHATPRCSRWSASSTTTPVARSSRVRTSRRGCGRRG
jgi:DNA-binding GntR family transcriptional regulator